MKHQITNQTSPTAFQFLYMSTIAINIGDGQGLSNKVHHELLLKKSMLFISYTVKMHVDYY